ncbi:MAG: response regulator, partial [Sulfurovaceae bacterium]|nr:response regulator [Sulfurovaceae bacterium]
ELIHDIHRLDADKVTIITNFSNRNKLESLGIKNSKVIYKPITPTKVLNAINTIEQIRNNKKESVTTNTENISTLFNNIQFEGKVLVAEDNFINQKLIKQILVKYGIEVELANNGLEAFEKIKDNKYDLILMDIQMPVMDGIEATHEIINYEKEESLTHIPIIALTANALKGDRERFIEDGLDEYIAKPIQNNELLFILKKFLNQAQTPIIEQKRDPSTIKEKKSSVNMISSNKTGGITLLSEDDEDTEQEPKQILIAKQNPLEAQILSKVLSNLNYPIEIINDMKSLKARITDKKYDILLIDRELAKSNKEIIANQHKNMNVILLSLSKTENSFNKNIIKEELIGRIQINDLKRTIDKYRSSI